MQQVRDWLEQQQVSIYLVIVVLAAIWGSVVPAYAASESWINPALAFMLFVTFLQVPLAALGKGLTNLRFMGALLVANFIFVPVLVAVLVKLFSPEPMLLLGILLVLLAPCIDYVVTFAHLGRADAKLLLAATPVLLIVQMLLLPMYLGLFLGDAATGMIEMAPFIDAFVWLIAVPLIAAAVLQSVARRNASVSHFTDYLGLLPVPATALVLLIVVAAVVPQLGQASAAVLTVIPVYIAFAVLAPVAGWCAGKLFRLESAANRAVMFSAGTRNSLVVLPLAIAVPGAIPVLPAIIVTQTLVELVSELVYVRLMPRLVR
jgi:ACR3 family arsenite transporter